MNPMDDKLVNPTFMKMTRGEESKELFQPLDRYNYYYMDKNWIDEA